MRKIFVILAVLLLPVLHALATTTNIPWQKANALYTQKEYDSAAFYYEQAAALQQQNATIYYNLGNVYYRLNNIPNAVLYYEKALRIKPDYKEAKDNLLITQSRIKNRIQPTPDIFFVVWWHTLTAGSMSATWAIVSLLLFLLIIVLLIVKRLYKNIPVQLTGILSFIWVLFLFIAFTSAYNSTMHNSAVVMQNDAPLMNNQQKGKPLGLVPEGTTVTVKEEHAGWTEVQLPDGRVGWVQQDVLNKI